MLPGQVGYSGHALFRFQRIQLQEVWGRPYCLSRTLVVMAERGLQICESQAARYFCEIWPAGCRMAVMALKISLVWRRVLEAAVLTEKTSRLMPRWDFFASDEPSWGINVFFSIPDLCGEIFLSPCKERCFLKVACDIAPFISFLTT